LNLLGNGYERFCQFISSRIGPAIVAFPSRFTQPQMCPGIVRNLLQI
jgi:hypothetical protein